METIEEQFLVGKDIIGQLKALQINIGKYRYREK